VAEKVPAGHSSHFWDELKKDPGPQSYGGGMHEPPEDDIPDQQDVVHENEIGLLPWAPSTRMARILSEPVALVSCTVLMFGSCISPCSPTKSACSCSEEADDVSMA
jgi:hypothetical protein